MNTLELMLQDAGAHVDWPATPPIADRLELAPPARRRARVQIRRPLAIALASLLVLTAGAAAIPGIREPVLDWLGLRSVRIERVPRPLPVVPGQRLALGERTTLAKARASAAFEPVAATGLGAPVVWFDTFPEGGQVALVYRGGDILLTEVRGHLEQRFLFKFLGPDAKAAQVRVNGQPGVWIDGAPHQYAYADANGQLRTDSVRFARDALLWRRGELLLRLEGAGSRAAALRIARAVR